MSGKFNDAFKMTGRFNETAWSELNSLPQHEEFKANPDYTNQYRNSVVGTKEKLEEYRKLLLKITKGDEETVNKIVARHEKFIAEKNKNIEKSKLKNKKINELTN